MENKFFNILFKFISAYGTDLNLSRIVLELICLNSITKKQQIYNSEIPSIAATFSCTHCGKL